MSKTLKLSFLWHMHQPDYGDIEGVMRMPWVFLHAIKDYYDMPWILSKFSKLKATFNLSPSLIQQLHLCSQPLKNDYFFKLWNKYPSKLSAPQREWLIKICKSPNYDTVIKPMSRFNELYNLKSFSDAELIDFEMQFLLSWCGNYLRMNNETVQALLKKERGYSSEDKSILLHTLSVFTGEIIPFYKSLLEKGIISISTTPYFHPILPLLIDMHNVKKSNTHTKTPQNPISFKEDAIKQVRDAIALYKETFGTDPVGFWPAEGAVDMQSAAIYKNEGIQWIATDEAILFKSLGSSLREDLYKTYEYNGLFIAFREQKFSNLFGFDYRFKPADKAVENFIELIEPVASASKENTLFIILDGENAWEYYEQNAYPFFMKLYENLSNLSWCKTVRMDEMLNNETEKLTTLASGSWIGGDFSTWSGNVEKNHAWELLFQTRRDFDNCAHKITQEDSKKIEKHFLAAQSSDWFWWYGDEHFTEFALEFDSLFRQHLRAIYQIMDIQPPAAIFEPIAKHKNTASFMTKPQAHIHPMINAKPSSFFEWIGCGVIDESRLFSTTDTTKAPVQKIRYGHNESRVYIAFDGDMTRLNKEKCSLEIIIEELSESIKIKKGLREYLPGTVLSIGSSIEIALPKTIFANMQTVHLRFVIEQDDKIVQILPGYGALEIHLDEDYSSNWFV